MTVSWLTKNAILLQESFRSFFRICQLRSCCHSSSYSKLSHMQLIKNIYEQWKHYFRGTSLTNIIIFLFVRLMRKTTLKEVAFSVTYTITDTVFWKISLCHLWPKVFAPLHLSKLIFFCVYINCNKWTLTAIFIFPFHFFDELSFRELSPLL